MTLLRTPGRPFEVPVHEVWRVVSSCRMSGTERPGTTSDGERGFLAWPTPHRWCGKTGRLSQRPSTARGTRVFGSVITAPATRPMTTPNTPGGCTASTRPPAAFVGIGFHSKEFHPCAGIPSRVMPTALRPPTARQSGRRRNATSSHFSSSLTAIRKAWKVRVAGSSVSLRWRG